MALRFSLSVQEVRTATDDEIQHQHAHGADGLHVIDEDEDDDDGEPRKDAGPTLH
jgi:FKBP-type peptidyl-prolyl cis-trans isomerase SlyD